MKGRPVPWRSVGVLVTVAVVALVVGLWPRQRPAGPEAMAGWEVQVELPMQVYSPQGIAVADNGDIYVAESGIVLKLPAGRYVPEATVLPEHSFPYSVALGPAGELTVSDYSNRRVLRIVGTEISVLPFTGLGRGDAETGSSAFGVAADRAGNVYLTDPDNSRVLKLPAGTDTPVELPAVPDLRAPIAVADSGDLVVTTHDQDRNVSIHTLRAGMPTFVATALPGIEHIAAVTFDRQGNLLFVGKIRLDDPALARVPYASRLWIMQADTTVPKLLAFTDLGEVTGIAVDSSGNLLLSDNSGGRVFRLPPP